MLTRVPAFLYGTAMPIPIIHLHGDRREIGLKQGQRIRSLRLPQLSAGDLPFGKECRAIVERCHPAACVEFDAMLEASELPADRFASYYFGRTAPLAGGCTNIAVTAEGTAGGHAIVGRNYDWSYADRRWCEARQISPFGELRRIGFTHHWGGLCDAMNERGLTICIAALPARGQSRPGVQWHIAVDLVATTCSAAAEAAEALSRIPHVRSLAYLVVDSTTARLVETSPDRAVVHVPRNGILVGTNHRIGEQHEAGVRAGASLMRRSRALDLLMAHTGAVTRDMVKSVLRDHEGGICAGEHGDMPTLPGSGAASGTIWSLAAEPATRAMEVAPGHPCETPFEDVPWP